MKVNIVGLLRMAKRHLALLDEIKLTHPEIEGDLQSRFEVISTEMILDELIENIEIVQNDPLQLESFLKIYCITK